MITAIALGGAVIALCFGSAIVIALFIIGRFARPHVGPPLGWHDCSHCTGGVQAHLRGRWGTIPWELREVVSETEEHRPPLANIRDCPHCNGLTGYWTPTDANPPTRPLKKVPRWLVSVTFDKQNLDTAEQAGWRAKWHRG